ncbi:MAG: ion transporter [Gemmatimonadota bacterium]
MTFRQRLKEWVERTDTPAGRAFDLVIQALILLSLATFSLETVPGISPEVLGFLGVTEIVVVLVFTIEYLLRILVADRRRDFIFSFYGLVDLAAILPFYLTTGLDLRSVRAIRLLRLFRILKLGRYSPALHRFREAFFHAKDELILFLGASAIMVYLASVGIYYFENPVQPKAFASVFHAMWWAMVTLTTVGYGDVYPLTLGGRLFTGLVLVVGLGIVSVPAGVVASALSHVRQQEAVRDRVAQEAAGGSAPDGPSPDAPAPEEEALREDVGEALP